MFRRKEDTISPDASYPADLEKLGFFINKLGHIRMLEAPEKSFVFNATNIERHNEVRNEALHACSRAEVLERLSKLGLQQLYFPQLAATKPAGAHVPILAPPLHILKNRKRIIVVINDAVQDLGILAYRKLQRELGLNGGSVVNFAKELVRRARDGGQNTFSNIFNDGAAIENDEETPGLIVMNTGQLLYSHKYSRTLTTRSWYALPRKSIAHDHIRIHDQENYVDGHRNAVEHIKSVFDQLLCDSNRVAPEAEVYIVAIEGGAESVLEVFGDDFEKYGNRVAAMAAIHTLIDNSGINHPSVKTFLHQRTRQWKYSDLSTSPTQCTQIPDDYSSTVSNGNVPRSSTPVRWNEEITKQSDTTKSLPQLPPSIVPPTNKTKAATPSGSGSEWGRASVPCPTFAGGQEPTGECIFTDTKVQHAILSFFEQVAQHPCHYRNPSFTALAQIPHPTIDTPLALSADATMQATTAIEAASHMLTPSQLELEDARAKLNDMRVALEACPDDVDALSKGRAKLAKKITKQETAVRDLQARALSKEGLGAGEAHDERQAWESEGDGPQVPFAGTMVSSELLKCAGLSDTAGEEVEKRVEEEKALV